MCWTLMYDTRWRHKHGLELLSMLRDVLFEPQTLNFSLWKLEGVRRGVSPTGVVGGGIRQEGASAQTYPVKCAPVSLRPR